MLNFYSIGIFESVVLDYPNMIATSQKLMIPNRINEDKLFSIVKLLKIKHKIMFVNMKVNPEWTVNIITNNEDPFIETALTYLTNNKFIIRK